MTNKKQKRQLCKHFTLQKDQSDCGVACLQNIIRYHGGEISLENLRELSGTDKQGTSLLGLYQCAAQIGFDGQGAEAEGLQNLKEVKHPCILHLTIDNKLMHYVVYYPLSSMQWPQRNRKEPQTEENIHDKKEEVFLIGDPGKGIVEYDGSKLAKEWKTKSCLLLIPTERLQKIRSIKKNKWQWFKSVLKEDIELLWLAAFLGAIMAVLNLSTALFSQQLLDKILPHSQYTKLILGIILLTILLVAKSGMGYVRSFLLIKQAYQFNIRLTGGFYQSLLHLKKAFFDNRKTGDLMIAHASNESNYVDTIKGIGSIKVMNKEILFSKLGITIFTGFQETIFQLGKTKMRFNLLAECVGVFFLTGIILWSSILVLHHVLTIGAMMAVLQMATIVMHATTSISLTNIQLQEAKVAFDRMYEFSSLKPEYEINQIEAQEANQLEEFKNLTLRSLSFRFPGRKALLQNVSFEVKKHEITVIVGESGQGKSTLFQILQKMYGFENGDITANRYPFQNIDIITWRKIVGVVPQDITLFSGTVLDNILMEQQSENIKTVSECCEEYGLHQYFLRLPLQYATPVGEGGINLSGGQKQLVALARCLYRNPQLLLLDEPTSAMDKKTEQFVLELLLSLKARKSMLIISHRDSITNIADNIYTLEEGIIKNMKSSASSS